MNSNQLNHYRERIKQALNHLHAATTAMKFELKASSEQITSVFRDEMDCAKGEVDLKTMVEIHNHASEREAELKYALMRIELGTFGVCQMCEEEIDERRLAAHPGATLCIECQECREAGVSLELPRKRIPFLPRWLSPELRQLRRAA